jgi:ribosome-associated protein
MPASLPPIQIPMSELDISFSRSSGPGGQNVNKVNSRATLRWKPLESESLSEGVRRRFLEKFSSRLTRDGELILHSDRFRDQSRNIADVIERLHGMIAEVRTPQKKRVPTRPSRAAKAKRVDQKRAHSKKKRARRIVDSD